MNVADKSPAGKLADRFPASRIERWEKDGSSLEIRFVKPSVLLFTYRGPAVLDQLLFYEPIVDRVIQQGIRPVMFVDALDVGKYAPGVRDEIARWGKRIKDQAPPIQCLIRSRLLEMVVSLTNMVMSQPLLIAHSDEKKFEALVRQAIAEAR